MPNRLTHLLLLAFALLATGSIVAAVSELGKSAPAQAAAPAAAEAVLLPTVVVRPEPEIPVLAELTVSPSRAERIAAGLRDDDDKTPLDVVAERMRSSSQGLLPSGSGGFGMPYYSFGKTLPRANKE